MDFKGHRFTVDLSDDDNETGLDSRIPSSVSPSVPGAFVGDILERSSTIPPMAPKLKSTSSGFPEHKKRIRVSAFKQQRGGSTLPAADPYYVPTLPRDEVSSTNEIRTDQTFDEKERRKIDEENNRRLASMSAVEISQEREELLSTLDPSLIERLLRRANLDHGRGDTIFGEMPMNSTIVEAEQNVQPERELADLAIAAPKPVGKLVTVTKRVTLEDDKAPEKPIDLQPVSEKPTSTVFDLPQSSTHFPTPRVAPDLDPSDPEFFENLHKQYFPSLPADPSKLAWAAPIPTHGSAADQESPYYPGLDGIAPSALRFSFKGGILPPRIARAVPVTKGLHHHGEAPEAAGYTIPELARLGRSAFPAQRSLAYQTLGRLLFRLGRGDFNYGGEELINGIRTCLDDGKVIQTLEEAAGAEGGHQASKAHAIDALWLRHMGERKGPALKAF